MPVAVAVTRWFVTFSMVGRWVASRSVDRSTQATTNAQGFVMDSHLTSACLPLAKQSTQSVARFLNLEKAPCCAENHRVSELGPSIIVSAPWRPLNAVLCSLRQPGVGFEHSGVGRRNRRVADPITLRRIPTIAFHFSNQLQRQRSWLRNVEVVFRTATGLGVASNNCVVVPLPRNVLSVVHVPLGGKWCARTIHGVLARCSSNNGGQRCHYGHSSHCGETTVQATDA